MTLEDYRFTLCMIDIAMIVYLVVNGGMIMKLVTYTKPGLRRIPYALLTLMPFAGISILTFALMAPDGQATKDILDNYRFSIGMLDAGLMIFCIWNGVSLMQLIDTAGISSRWKQVPYKLSSLAPLVMWWYLTEALMMTR